MDRFGEEAERRQMGCGEDRWGCYEVSGVGVLGDRLGNTIMVQHMHDGVR